MGKEVASPTTHSIWAGIAFADASLPIASNGRQRSTPMTRWPAWAAGFACRPWPHPTSRIADLEGRVATNSRTSGHGRVREAAYEDAIRSYVSRMDAFDRCIKRKSSRREIKALSGFERHPLRLLQRALADFCEGRQRRGRAPAIQVPNVRRRHLRAADGARLRADLVRAVFRTPLQVLPTTELPALRGRCAIDLDDVHREIDRRGVAQARADAESVNARFEQRRNRFLVDPSGDEDLDILVTSQVELPPDLTDDRREIPPTGGRRIEPHAREVGDRLDGHERLRLLVVVRVHQRDPRNLRLKILVGRRERLPRPAHHDDE